ncbi:unnamed protein product [Schistosoma spindalis]|nr:unnamed protein product [Schistosoma spindale]
MEYCPIDPCNIHSQMGVFVINENIGRKNQRIFYTKLQNRSVKYDNHTLNTLFANSNNLSIISSVILQVHNSFLFALPFFSTLFYQSSAARLLLPIDFTYYLCLTT